MKERPILFSGEMVRALLDGRKTQTRRVVKPNMREAIGIQWRDPGDGCLWPYNWLEDEHQLGMDEIPVPCPYGQPGDRLWVRETHSFVPDDDEPAGCSAVLYAADGHQYGKLRPSIHMPRWASRITLEIVSVRVERLQEISEADAEAEGPDRGTTVGWSGALGSPCRMHESWVSAFRHLWQSINGDDSWDANPGVWVVEFKRVEDARETA